MREDMLSAKEWEAAMRELRALGAGEVRTYLRGPGKFRASALMAGVFEYADRDALVRLMTFEFLVDIALRYRGYLTIQAFDRPGLEGRSAVSLTVVRAANADEVSTDTDLAEVIQ